MKPVLFLLLPVLVFAQNAASKPDWALTFSDEFNGKELDLTRWSPHDPLRSVYAAEPITVSNGQLHLARGQVVTTFGMFSQTYGKFEIRCKGTAGSRGKSGFRLLPVPLSSLPSIDVLEWDGGAPAKYLFANHWGSLQTERSYGDSFDGPELSADFHVISVEWNADRIVWFIDGKERFAATDGIPRQRMFLIIDLAGDIDYVRVYARGRS